MHTDGSWDHDTQIMQVSMTATPGAVFCDGTIYVFYEGGGSNGQSNGQLYNVCSIDGGTWYGPFQTLPIAIANSPAATVFNGQIVCMMQSANDGELAYTIINPGNSSPFMSALNGTHMTGSPGITVFNNQLFCFYPNEGGEMCYYFCEEACSGPMAMGFLPTISGSPAPVVFNENLYVFFQTSDGLNYAYSSTGAITQWSGANPVPNLDNPFAPSAVTFGDNLYLFYTYYIDITPDGYELPIDNSRFWYTVASLNASGQLDWAPPVEIRIGNTSDPFASIAYTYNSAAAPVVFNETLYVFFLGSGGEDYSTPAASQGEFYSYIFCTAFSNGTWTYPVCVCDTMAILTDSVAVVSYDNGNGSMLYCIFQNGSGDLYYISTSNPGSAGSWSAPVQLGSSATTPTSSPPGVISELADLSIGCIKMIVGN